MNAHLVRQLLGARLTIALVLFWLAIEVCRSVAFAGSDDFYIMLGLSRGGMRSLWLWQPLTYGFIHSGWVHVIMNMLLLLSVGSRLEWMLGRRSLGLILLAGALSGALLHLVVSWNILVGGSGAVFAALLCITTLSSDSRWLVPFPLSAKNLGRGLMLSFLILVLITPALGIPGLSRLGVALVDAGWGQLFKISHACHLGGAVAGWLSARWILRNRVSLDRLRRQRTSREAMRGD